MDQTWTTKDGTIIPISEMSNEHLINTISYLFRIAPSNKLRIAEELESLGWSALSYSATTSAEMASYYAGQEGSNLLDRAVEIKDDKRTIVHDKLPLLLKEALRRKLALPTNVDMDYITVTEITNE